MSNEEVAQFVVYVIRHRHSRLSYVGTTCNVERRWRQHCGGGKNSSPRLFHAIQKYGRCAFGLWVVGRFAKASHAYEAERAWIRTMQSNDPAFGYNLTSGGVGGSPGVPKSPEHRRKIGDAQRGRPGRPHSEETRERSSRSHKTSAAAWAQIERLSDYHRGRSLSEEHRAKLSTEAFARHGHVCGPGCTQKHSRRIDRKPIHRGAT